jgi:tRNA(Ile)-lysidine synthase
MARRPPAVARVLERVTATAREHDMFAEGDRVMVMVSGGPDSTCLLYSLHLLRRLLKIRLHVVHVDHGLRKDSPKDAAYVRRVAGNLKVPFVLRTATGAPTPGESVEAWARTIRYAAATDAAREAGAARIAVGHTVDDQAETVLIQLVRGAGPRGIAGMRPAAPHVVRPLIDVRRDEVLAFCRALRLRPRTDPTNADTRLLRNAIRLEVIPTLERATGRDVRGPIARSARLLQQDLDRYGPAVTPEAGAGVAERTDDGMLLFLHRFPDEAFHARLVAQVLRELEAPVSQASIDAVLDLANGRPGRRRDLGGGLLAVRDREYIRLARTSPGVR